MTTRTRNLLLFLVLAAAALGTWMLAREPARVVETRRDTTPPARSFYLVDAVVYGTDPEGRIRYQVEADRVEQEEMSDQLTFESMRVRYAPDMDVNWQITATRGVASESLGQLRLMDDIRLTLSPGGDEDDLTFQTSELTLYADEFRVQTEAAVMVQREGIEATGLGLSADLQSDVWSCCDGGKVIHAR